MEPAAVQTQLAQAVERACRSNLEQAVRTTDGKLTREHRRTLAEVNRRLAWRLLGPAVDAAADPASGAVPAAPFRLDDAFDD